MHCTIETVDENLATLAEALLENCLPAAFHADAGGLDARAGRGIRVGPGFIAVPEGCDRSMQYYGGFEYVDKSLRRDLGTYVFYFVDDREEFSDDRVGRFIERLRPSL